MIRDFPTTPTKDSKRNFEMMKYECVVCNLCVLMCPTAQCISLRSLKPGDVNIRMGQVVKSTVMNWAAYPNNLQRVSA